MKNETNNSFLETILSVPSKLISVSNSAHSSLLDATAVYRVEPLVIIDEQLRQDDVTQALCPHLLNVFIGSYVQTVNVLGVNVAAVSSMAFIDRLNPNRHYIISTESEDLSIMNQDAYNCVLPEPGVKAPQVSLESNDGNNAVSINPAPNLAVGETVVVTTGNGEEKQRHTINFRIIPMTCSSSAIVNFFDSVSSGVTLKDRWEMVKSGRIKFMRDFVFCRDILKNYMSKRIKSPSDAIDVVTKRQGRNISTSIVTGKVSLAACSNFYIISADTARIIESKTGRSFSKGGFTFDGRDGYFKDVAAMGIAIVDPNWETATVYYYGVDAGAKLSLNQLRNGKKNDVADVVSVMLKAFTSGANPAAF